MVIKIIEMSDLIELIVCKLGMCNLVGILIFLDFELEFFRVVCFLMVWVRGIKILG